MAEPKPKVKAEPKAEPKKSTPAVPSDIADVLQTRKNQKDFEAGEKARKKNMGEIGFKSGGSVGSASRRADGCAARGKTKGRMI